MSVEYRTVLTRVEASYFLRLHDLDIDMGYAMGSLMACARISPRRI